MTDLEKAARLALEALESLRNNPNVEIWFDRGDNAITALRRALEQPAQQWLYDPMTGKAIQDEQPTGKQSLQVEQPAQGESK